MGETYRVYQIAKWDEHFESSKSRTYKSKGKGNFPIKLGGSGYRRMMREKDGPAMYGCFVALCMIAHMGSSAERRGYLTDTGGIAGEPYDIETLSLLTDMPEGLINRTIDFCSKKNVGWVIIHSVQAFESTGVVQGYHNICVVPPNKQVDKQVNRQESTARAHANTSDSDINPTDQATMEWDYPDFVKHFQSIRPENERVGEMLITNALQFAPDKELMVEAYNQCVADLLGYTDTVSNPSKMLKAYMRNADKYNGKKRLTRGGTWSKIREKAAKEGQK